jgi:hypothetical protein
MSNHGHHHRKSRKKNPIGEFFDRLTGRRSRRHYHRSEFPGINLPSDYDPVAWKGKSMSSKLPSRLEDEKPQDIERDFSDNNPENQPAYKYEKPGPVSSKRKKSIFSAFGMYSKQRELRREERMKEKLRREHRRRSEQEFRKMNKGPGWIKKTFSLGTTLDETEKEKQVPLFSQRSPVYRNMTITVNSILVFITTYILVYLFYWLTCMLVASFYGLDSTLYYYDLKFNDHSPVWNRLNILIITGLPPFLSLILGMFLFQVVFKIKRFAGLQKLFILWSAFHLFNHFFGALPSGIVTDEGFGYVAAWLYMNTAFKFMFSLLSLFALGLIGYWSAKAILETSDSLHRIKGDNRLSFMLFQTGIPWLVGTIILLLARIPENFNYPYETLMLFSAAFLVIPPFFNEKVKPELNLLKAKKKRNIHLGYLTMMILLLLFLRVMLGIGLHFIIEINISISPANL